MNETTEIALPEVENAKISEQNDLESNCAIFIQNFRKINVCHFLLCGLLFIYLIYLLINS